MTNFDLIHFSVNIYKQAKLLNFKQENLFVGDISYHYDDKI